MAKRRTNSQFLKTKEKVLENLEALHFTVDEYTTQGMMDEGSLLYNQILLIIDEADDAHTFEELEEIIQKAKQVEHNLDAWCAQTGGTSMELEWPSFEERSD